MLGIEDRKALQQFSRVRDVDVAVEIGKGIIDAGALAAGLVLTGPTGLFVGLGIDSLAIGLCVEHGDDEEAITRTVGVIAGVGLGAVSKYADDVADLTDDTFGSVYKNSLDDVDGFKGLNLDDSKIFFKNADDVKPLENGPYIRNGKPNGRPTLTGKKKLEFEREVYKNCVDSDGVLRDPNTKEIINWKPGEPRNGVVDFGHTEGNTYHEMFMKYKNREISLEQLKQFQFDPKNYRLESPSANRSHLYE